MESPETTVYYSQPNTQTDMPRGRSRSKSSSRSSKRARTSRSIRPAKTNDTRNIWPYSSMGMGQLWDPFPQRAQAKLRYSTTVTLNPTTGLTASHLFRANGIQDPDFTGIGHQPYGHDTYANIYNHYNVRACTITMTPTYAVNGIYGIAINDDSTVELNYDTIREMKGTRIGVMGNLGTSGKSVVNYFNCNQSFDLPFQKSTSASFGANPSEGVIFHCFAEGAADTIDPTGSSFLITLTYIVDMWELKDLGQS